ncbi:WD40-repeat-containing domain protein [Lentinula edodes]|uniref:WD40-repeat-containing domain protein n=1 Tax=Lentinula lateritia TaxID=40482 RepID=A0A9W9AHM5_9AGAR|nr:WD40-repeat-containing domain protein [Lentinula edodes]
MTFTPIWFEIYLWRADTDEPTPLCTIPSEKDEYSALAWMQTSPIIALATYRGHLEVYELVRRYRNALGSGDLSIKHWEFRESSAKPFKESKGHKSEDGAVHASMLESGVNDPKICIWDLRGSTRHPGLTSASNPAALSISSGGKQVTDILPLYEFKKHKAAVKCLAPNPYHSGILAFGGGVRDRCIRIWNTTTRRIRTRLILIFFDLVIPREFHRARVQHVALNPNGDTIVTGSGAQSLYFWNIFRERHQM